MTEKIIICLHSLFKLALFYAWGAVIAIALFTLFYIALA